MEIESMKTSIGNIRENVDVLKGQISWLRREGSDTKIAELRIMNIPSKIGLLEVTKDEGDLRKLEEAIKVVKEEVENIEKEKFKNMENESGGIEVEDIDLLIEKVDKYLKSNQREEALFIYSKIQATYPKLSHQAKERIFPICQEIHDRLDENIINQKKR